MAYRSDLDALTAHHTHLEADVAERTREREASRRMLDEARAKVRLRVLDRLEIAAPCGGQWSRMTGSDRVRHCADCKQNVYDLTAMTRDEAEALVAEREGEVCVRFYKRADGTVMTSDCRVGVSQRRRRRLFKWGLIA